jgi:hypothetical protein
MSPLRPGLAVRALTPEAYLNSTFSLLFIGLGIIQLPGPWLNDELDTRAHMNGSKVESVGYVACKKATLRNLYDI